MNSKELIRGIEAVLFASGEPMSIERIAQTFDITPEKAVKSVEALNEEYKKCDSGIVIVRLENTYQMASDERFAEYIKKAFDMRRRTPLSSAALEVLAVVAYNQPVTKSFIEQVRGVDCSGVVSTLVEKGLIEERGRLELPGKPLLYGTTKNFLRCFGISDLSELPALPKEENAVDDVAEQLEMNNEVLEEEV
jgi:segregation and condensation protein B